MGTCCVKKNHSFCISLRITLLVLHYLPKEWLILEPYYVYIEPYLPCMTWREFLLVQIWLVSGWLYEISFLCIFNKKSLVH